MKVNHVKDLNPIYEQSNVSEHIIFINYINISI